jgi:AcrR family transcriptional regulator
VRSENRERNRRALLDAASELAEQHGYGGTSLAAVAARAGLSTGAVYSIFGGKAELFMELLLPQWHVPTSDELPGEQTDVAGFVESYARHWVARLRAGDPHRAFELELELYLAALRDPAILERTRRISAASQDALTSHIEGLRGRKAVPARELARSLVAALQGLSQAALAAAEDFDEELFVRVARRVAGVGDRR